MGVIKCVFQRKWKVPISVVHKAQYPTKAPVGYVKNRNTIFYEDTPS